MSHRYEIAPCRHWKNTKTGRTASLYGAVPYTDGDRKDWEIVVNGFGYWDHNNGTFHNFNGNPGVNENDAAAKLSRFTNNFALPVTT